MSIQKGINCTRNLFEEKLAIEKIDYFNLFKGDIKHPSYPEGEASLTIMKCKSEELYGKYSGNIKIEFILVDDSGNQLNQLFFLKYGKNNNFGKFIYQVLGYEPEDEFSLKELEGKKIIATISHYYNDAGVGYANIAFCKPV